MDNCVVGMCELFESWKLEFLDRFSKEQGVKLDLLKERYMEPKSVVSQLKDRISSRRQRTGSSVGSLRSNKKRQMSLPDQDDRCQALKRDGIQCSKKRSTKEGHDDTLCSLHNRYKPEKRFSGTQEDTKPVEPEQPVEQIKKEEKKYEEVEISVEQDKEGDYVDKEGNIYDIETSEIIGKKDLKTGKKTFTNSK